MWIYSQTILCESAKRCLIELFMDSLQTPTIQPALYLVSTPIGNKEDITIRSLKLLQQVHYIACEDTRTTGQLLKMYGIANKHFIPCPEQQQAEKSEYIRSLIQHGNPVIYVSDAGSPCISDPGSWLVSSMIEHQIQVIALPGATAFVPAVQISGFDTSRFYFYGFLPKKGRSSILITLLQKEETVVLYESTHRIISLLEEISAIEQTRALCICRELTKKFEETIRGTVSECLVQLQKDTQSIKGEFVVVVEGIYDK